VEIPELRDLAASGRLYAIIDACATPSVVEKAWEIGETHAISLYRGSADEMYSAFAPYLFAVDGDLLDWILSELWTEPWGIFAVSDAEFDALRRHFRRFLIVGAGTEQWYFRFYDPRVLRIVLGATNSVQNSRIFQKNVMLVIGSVECAPTVFQYHSRVRKISLSKPGDAGVSMLAIEFTSEQISQISRSMRSQFIRDTASNLGTNFNILADEANELEKWCERWITISEQYQIDDRSRVVRFLESCLALSRIHGEMATQEVVRQVAEQQRSPDAFVENLFRSALLLT